MSRYWVYILKSNLDGNFYVGSTGNLEDRLKRHFAGRSKATKHRLPLRLVWFRQFNNKSEAVKTERYIKKCRNHQFIEKLIQEWARSSGGRAPAF